MPTLGTRPTAFATKNTECRKADIVAKQSDCIVFSRKTNITGTRCFRTHGSASGAPAAAGALRQLQLSDKEYANCEWRESHSGAGRFTKPWTHSPTREPAARPNEGASRGVANNEAVCARQPLAVMTAGHTA